MVVGASFRDDGEFFRQLLRECIAEAATRQRLTPLELFELNFKVTVDYSVAQAAHMAAVEWGNGDCRRARQLMVTDKTLCDYDGRKYMADELTSNIDLRGELYFLRLHKRFPNRIKEVKVRRDIERMLNRVRVEFQNGQVAEDDEHQIESTEFLAKCAMIYDL